LRTYTANTTAEKRNGGKPKSGKPKSGKPKSGKPKSGKLILPKNEYKNIF
jgi:hypothetical protein